MKATITKKFLELNQKLGRSVSEGDFDVRQVEVLPEGGFIWSVVLWDKEEKVIFNYAEETGELRFVGVKPY